MKNWMLFLFLLNTFTGVAQVEGTVYEINNQQEKSPLPGANIFWKGTQVGTSSDLQGKFSINRVSESDQLIVKYVGYKTDTLDLSKFSSPLEVILLSGSQLSTFKVEYRRKSSEISLINPLNITHIGEQELRKAACCNLSESFETNASVDILL